MKFSIKSLLVIATFAAILLALAFAWHRDRATLLERLEQERARAQAAIEAAEMAEYQRTLAGAESQFREDRAKALAQQSEKAAQQRITELESEVAMLRATLQKRDNGLLNSATSRPE